MVDVTNVSALTAEDIEPGVDLEDASLGGVDLSDATLTEASLSGVTLRDAALFRADLSGADLPAADLREASLSGADLSHANLNGADLRNANLRDADLSGVDLRDADLRDATLRHVTLCNADLRDAVLSDVTLSKADLTDADIRRADLSSGDLSKAVLNDADLRDANLSSSSAVSSTDLVEADLRGADLSAAALRYVEFAAADLSRAVLSEADLGHADLTEADLTEVDLSATTLSEATFRDADLSDATLRDAECEKIELSGATLRGTTIDIECHVGIVIETDSELGATSEWENDETVQIGGQQVEFIPGIIAASDLSLDERIDEQLQEAAAELKELGGGSVPDPESLSADDTMRFDQLKKKMHHLKRLAETDGPQKTVEITPTIQLLYNDSAIRHGQESKSIWFDETTVETLAVDLCELVSNYEIESLTVAPVLGLYPTNASTPPLPRVSMESGIEVKPVVKDKLGPAIKTARTLSKNGC